MAPNKKKKKIQQRVTGKSVGKDPSSRVKYRYIAFWAKRQTLFNEEDDEIMQVRPWQPIGPNETNNKTTKNVVLLQTSANGVAKKFVSYIHRNIFPGNQEVVDFYILQDCIRPKCNERPEKNQIRTRIYHYTGKFCLKKDIIKGENKDCSGKIGFQNRNYRPKTRKFYSENENRNATHIDYKGLSTVSKKDSVYSVPFRITDLKMIKIVINAIKNFPHERKLILRNAIYACAQNPEKRARLMQKMKLLIENQAKGINLKRQRRS